MAKLMQKPFKRFSCVAAYACTPFLLGILGGYPVGAIAISELVKDEKISSKEAERILPFCNNTGPAFIVGAVGSGIFASGKAGIMLYCCHIAAALILAVLSLHSLRNEQTFSLESVDNYPSLLRILPACVRLALDKCFTICSFVIFFAVISEILKSLGIISSVSLALNKASGLEIGICESLIAGFTELGGGIASMAGMKLCRSSLTLAAFILGFGSLSVHCQTFAVVSEANIKCARHFVGRILHGAISALLIYIFYGIIRI
ncbi:MAG: hypothetical protein E7420_02555 [Ruminococcaceae bacterium]|nr:hypothetical protein [Oscillospiraceae bacterium]